VGGPFSREKLEGKVFSREKVFAPTIHKQGTTDSVFVWNDMNEVRERERERQREGSSFSRKISLSPRCSTGPRLPCTRIALT